jgi:hypothetical protein
VDHLLLHCEITNALWSAIYSRIDIAWVVPKKDLFACWRWLGGNSQSTIIFLISNSQSTIMWKMV